MYNTIVIGAGPVGSYLAHKLTLQGQKVIVFDHKLAPGHNVCCTGIISKECNDLLSPAKNSVIRQVNSAKLFTPSGRHIRIWREGEIAFITDRQVLEQILVSRALSSGTDYQFKTNVLGIEHGNNCLLIRVNDTSGEKVFKSEAAIIATGYGSNLTTNLGLGKIGHFIFGAQTEVTTNKIDEVEIYLNQKVSPGGFAWLVPTRNDKALAGMITNHQPKLHLKQLLFDLKTQNKIASTGNTTDYTAIPLRPLPKTYTDRILVVGEAAGQVKPTTGGGIYYGILCADIASTILHQAFKSGDLSAGKLSTYQKQWRNKLARELTIGYWAQRLWGKLNNKQIEYLLNIAQRKDVHGLIATTNKFSFDWHSQMLLQIAYSLLPFAKPRKQL